MSSNSSRNTQKKIQRQAIKQAKEEEVVFKHKEVRKIEQTLEKQQEKLLNRYLNQSKTQKAKPMNKHKQQLQKQVNPKKQQKTQKKQPPNKVVSLKPVKSQKTNKKESKPIVSSSDKKVNCGALSVIACQDTAHCTVHHKKCIPTCYKHTKLDICHRYVGCVFNKKGAFGVFGSCENGKSDKFIATKEKEDADKQMKDTKNFLAKECPKLNVTDFCIMQAIAIRTCKVSGDYVKALTCQASTGEMSIYYPKGHDEHKTCVQAFVKGTQCSD